jgi:hypothetical protein
VKLNFACTAARKIFQLLETNMKANAYLVDQQYAGFILSEVPMKILITAAMFSALALTPASAKMMACSGENMGKTSMMIANMDEGPHKMGMNKEMMMANTDMSKGNMRGACMHYMKAQKMSMMKSGM